MRSQYERTAIEEPCRRFEFASCKYDHRIGDNDNTLNIAFRWFRWFKKCRIPTAIEKRPCTLPGGTSGTEYVVWRAGPRWKQETQKPSNQVIIGEVIADYDEKGVFK